MPSAYLLVSHGSRDPRPQVAIERLVWLISQSLTRNAQLQTAGMHECKGAEKQGRKINPKSKIQNLESLHLPLVSSACLELSSLALHQQIADFGDRALELGCDRLQIVPLFLLPGVHVMEDIPAEVAIAQQSLGQLKLEVRPYLGSHPGLIRLLASQLDKAKKWILLAHGSSRAGAKQPTEAIAGQLGTLSAYWAIAPSLESRVQELVTGEAQIGILPYFLFAGGITDAIAQKVKRLQEQFPSVDFHLAQPLGASQELADLILDLVEK